MKIKFLQDYRGVLTDERFFEAGTVLDLDDKENKGINGEKLIKDGRAEKAGVGSKSKKDEEKE